MRIMIVTSLLIGLCVHTAASAASIFLPSTQTTIEATAERVAVGDVTGDGRNDVVVVSGEFASENYPMNRHFMIFEQLPNGSMAAPIAVPFTNVDPQILGGAIELVDLDGDQTKEIVLGVRSTIVVFKRQANGNYSQSATAPIPATVLGISNIMSVDVNRDGHMDLIGRSPYYRTSIIFLGDGIGGIASQYVIETMGTKLHAIGDINSDGFPDLASEDHAGAPGVDFWIRKHDGYSGFLPPTSWYLPNHWEATRGIAIGDFSGDARNDIAIAGRCVEPDFAVFWIYKQDSSGALQSPTPVTGPCGRALVSADIDMDGRLDLVMLFFDIVAYRGSATGIAYYNTFPLIPFGPQYSFHEESAAIADINGDACPDAILLEMRRGMFIARGQGCERAADIATTISEISDINNDRIVAVDVKHLGGADVDYARVNVRMFPYYDIKAPKGCVEILTVRSARVFDCDAGKLSRNGANQLKFQINQPLTSDLQISATASSELLDSSEDNNKRKFVIAH